MAELADKRNYPKFKILYETWELVSEDDIKSYKQPMTDDEKMILKSQIDLFKESAFVQF